MTTPTVTLAWGGLLKTIAVGVVARIHERRDGAMTTTGIAAKPGGQGAKTAARLAAVRDCYPGPDFLRRERTEQSQAARQGELFDTDRR